MSPESSNPDTEPFGRDTDEAVSALLDNELAAFAADHGISESEARDRLTAWPDLESRTAELGAARAALQDTARQDPAAAASEELSELDRKRLVRNALAASSAPIPDAADSPRRGRAWQRIVAAAAAVVVVIGIGVAISRVDNSGGSDSASKSSTAGGSTAPTPRQGNLGNVGDVTSPADLRALLDPSHESAKADANRDATRTQAGGSSADLSPEAGLANGGSAAVPAPPTATADACAAQLAGTRPVVLTATGTYRGAPAVIVGINDKGRTIVFVVPPGDCTNVLTSISR